MPALTRRKTIFFVLYSLVLYLAFAAACVVIPSKLTAPVSRFTIMYPLPMFARMIIGFMTTDRWSVDVGTHCVAYDCVAVADFPVPSMEFVTAPTIELLYFATKTAAYALFVTPVTVYAMSTVFAHGNCYFADVMDMVGFTAAGSSHDKKAIAAANMCALYFIEIPL